MENENTKISLFRGKKIRKMYFENEWWFSVVDMVAVLTDSPTPRQYWGKVKQREFIDLQLSPIWVQLKLESPDGKKYSTDCVNTENALRLIQSIPAEFLWVDFDQAKENSAWANELKKLDITEAPSVILYSQRGEKYYCNYIRGRLATRKFLYSILKMCCIPFRKCCAP